jgi:hypothetical protein
MTSEVDMLIFFKQFSQTEKSPDNRWRVFDPNTAAAAKPEAWSRQV